MTEAQKVKVAAAILVHDAMDSLVNVVSAVEQQTFAVATIVVFDNASRNDVGAALGDRPNVQILRSSRNIGVGAGHAAAWKAALADHDVTHIWSLEHDTLPEVDCLEALVDASRRYEAGVYLPRLERNREEAMARDAALKDAPPEVLPRVTFNGILLPRSTIDQVGMPASEFFVGGEDAELSLRLRDHGLRILRIFSALALHPTKGNRRFGIRPSVSRSYYSTRNWMYLELRERGRIGAVWCCAWCVGSLPKIVAAEDHKVRRCAGRVTATIDALLGRMGQRRYWFLGN